MEGLRPSGARYDRTLQALGPLRPLCNWRRGVLRRHSDGARWCRLRYPQEKPSTSAGPASGAKSRPGLRRSPGRPIFSKRPFYDALRWRSEPRSAPMPSDPPIRSVLVTGASGNLGRKLIAHLLQRSWCERIVAIDREAGDAGSERRQRRRRRSARSGRSPLAKRARDDRRGRPPRRPEPLSAGALGRFLPLLRHDREPRRRGRGRGREAARLRLLEPRHGPVQGLRPSPTASARAN